MSIFWSTSNFLELVVQSAESYQQLLDRSPPKKVGWVSTRMSYTVVIQPRALRDIKETFLRSTFSTTE